MNAIEQVTQWVECKVGKYLNMDIIEKFQSETSSFDVDSYSQTLFETYFSHDLELNQLKSELSNESFSLNFESDDFYLTEDGFSRDSSDGDDDRFDFQAPSLESIIADLQSPDEETQRKGLEALEASSAEDLVVQTSWTMTRKILQDMMNTSGFERVRFKVLELFRRFLLSNDAPKVVCEGFVSLAESIALHIESINRRGSNEFLREVSRFNENDHWCSKPSVRDSVTAPGDDDGFSTEIEIIFRSMWLLIQSQKSMPLKWSRFNEKRLREIIFSFIGMLASSTNPQEDEYVSGLEILSVLDPKATWCYHWCHGATGRTLLCSALKSHKKLFSELIDFILTTVKNKESHTGHVKSESVSACNFHLKLPPIEIGNRGRGEYLKSNAERGKSSYDKKGLSPSDKLFTSSAKGFEKERNASKGNRSAPPFPFDGTRSSCKKKPTARIAADRIICGISKDVVTKAKLCHCISAVVCLIRFRGGRSLFPLEVTSRKRRMTVPGLIQTIANYAEDVIYEGTETENSPITEEYKNHMMKLLDILKSM